MDYRIGHGYDVHRLAAERRLIIGGVEIPYDKGLIGHSDADVAAHAVTDAVLGAAGLGDIGGMFPDSDECFRDADSIKLLEQAVLRVNKKGYKISNIDVTVVAQSPKLQDFLTLMRENIAKACKIASERVNVKATTEEKLGFTGEGKGISAHAVCIIFSK